MLTTNCACSGTSVIIQVGFYDDDYGYDGTGSGHYRRRQRVHPRELYDAPMPRLEVDDEARNRFTGPLAWAPRARKQYPPPHLLMTNAHLNRWREYRRRRNSTRTPVMPAAVEAR